MFNWIAPALITIAMVIFLFIQVYSWGKFDGQMQEKDELIKRLNSITLEKEGQL